MNKYKVELIEKQSYIVDVLAKSQDKPEFGKQYALTGSTGSKCIANGNTWKESEVINN